VVDLKGAAMQDTVDDGASVSLRHRFLRSSLGRYALFQLPELIIGAAVLAVLVHEDVLTTRWGWLLFALWVLKEIVLFPFLRTAYEPSDPSPASKMIGKAAVVIARLDLQGTVRVGPELWGARLSPGSDPVEAGVEVCVKAVEGLTLHVEKRPPG
jgi:membrane protein implicated in regulation of membrane protease activity